jgi:hypothetical protein
MFNDCIISRDKYAQDGAPRDSINKGASTKSYSGYIFAESRSLSTRNTDYPQECIVAVMKTVHVDAVSDEMKIGQITNRWSCPPGLRLLRVDSNG